MAAHAHGAVENKVVPLLLRPPPTERSADARHEAVKSDVYHPAVASPDYDSVHEAPSYAELEAEVRALRAEAGRSRQLLASAIDYAIITMDLNGRVTSTSAQ